MKLSGNLGKVGKSDVVPANQALVACIANSIETMNIRSSNPSDYYSPSGLNCIRQMYFKRSGCEVDSQPIQYCDVSAADTGTKRHESIQDALIYMSEHGSRFRYVDVPTYVNKRQSQGRCLSLKVEKQVGAETQLLDESRHIRFRCDGILYDTYDKEFYLFEFKNQISYNAAGKSSVDKKHYCQVFCYCAELDLDKALVLYENRDTLELYCPQIFKVSSYDKHLILDKIDECEKAYKSKVIPDKPSDLSPSECRWCLYKSTCKKY